MNGNTRPAKDTILNYLYSFNESFPEGRFREEDVDPNGLRRLRSVKYITKNGEYYYINEKGYSMLQRWFALDATRGLNSTLGNVRDSINHTLNEFNDTTNKSLKSMDKASSKLNTEMLKHTKVMKWLTWWIFGFTLINLILIIIQILMQKGII